MGQELSTSSSGRDQTCSPKGTVRRASSRSMRRSLLKSVTKRSSPDAPSGKKAKMPPQGDAVNNNKENSRDRLLSCPDLHHHTESEMVQKLEKLLIPHIQAEKSLLPANASSEQQSALKLFEGVNPPKITIESYLQRMVHYLGGIAESERKCGVDKNVRSDLAVRYILTSLLYIERIQKRTGVQITVYNVHRFLITGVMIAAKVLDDVQPNQKYFADLGGVSVAELCRLEAAFLFLCDYNVNVDPESFAAKYAVALERERVFSNASEVLALGAEFSPVPSRKQIAA